MKPSGLVIAAASLAVLSGALYWSNRREAARDPNAGTAEAPRMLTFEEPTVNRIDILRNRNEKVSLVKQESGQWQVEQEPPLVADSNIVTTLVSTLSALNSERLVEQQPADLAPYGLAQPPVEAEIRTSGGQSGKLLLGDQTPTGATVFAMVGGDQRLFTVTTYVKASVDKSAVDFADKKLFEFGFNFPEKVEMKIGGRSYTITYTGDEWQSNGARMDATSVQSVIARIRDLEAINFQGEGFGTPVVEFTITPSGGSPIERVALSRSGSNYLARREGRPALYVVDAALITDLQRYVNDMKPWTPPPAQPHMIVPPGAQAPSTPAPTP
jgi:hypothetical protein